MEICPGESTWRPCKSLCLKPLGKVALYQTELRSLPFRASQNQRNGSRLQVLLLRVMNSFRGFVRKLKI